MYGRTLVAAATAAALLGPVANTASAEPKHETRSFIYVAPVLAGIGGARVDGFAQSGVLVFTPRQRTYTLTIDDAGVLAGQTIPVSVDQPGGSTSICVPVRTPVTLRWLGRGKQVVAYIGGPVEGKLLGLDRCTGFATAGTATVVW